MHPFGSNNHTSIAINENAPLLHNVGHRRSLTGLGQLILLVFVLILIGIPIRMFVPYRVFIEYGFYAFIVIWILVLQYIGIIDMESTRAYLYLVTIIFLIAHLMIYEYFHKIDGCDV